MTTIDCPHHGEQIAVGRVGTTGPETEPTPVEQAYCGCWIGLTGKVRFTVYLDVVRDRGYYDPTPEPEGIDLIRELAAKGYETHGTSTALVGRDLREAGYDDTVVQAVIDGVYRLADDARRMANGR